MEVENQVSFIPPMLQKTQFGNVDDETTITFKEDTDTPMTIDASAPGDVIELSDDFDFDGYQVVRREFFAHMARQTGHPVIRWKAASSRYITGCCPRSVPTMTCCWRKRILTLFLQVAAQSTVMRSNRWWSAARSLLWQTFSAPCGNAGSNCVPARSFL